MIFIPQMLHTDQPYNANILEELGTGIHIPNDGISEEKFKNALSEILGNPMYKENCQKLAKSIENCGGIPRAVEGILALFPKK